MADYTVTVQDQTIVVEPFGASAIAPLVGVATQAVVDAQTARDAAEGFAQDAADQIPLVEAAGAAQVALAADEADRAEAAVGAVKQIVPFMYQSATVLTPGAWIGEAFVPVASTYTEWISDVDEGTAQLLVHVNDVNVLGPRTISATRDEATISVAAPKFARVTFQIGAVTGSPKRISSYLIGLPTS